MLHAAPADIWRLLIPSSCWLFPEEVPDDELIFHYRDHIYFVNSDGSVISMPKPAGCELMGLGELLDLLATAEETYDFDDNGEFDYGCILKRMGYVVPTSGTGEKADYLVEIVNTIAPQSMVTRYELSRVSFAFALYHALLRCHELNGKSDWEFEHEVKRISPVERLQMKDLLIQQHFPPSR
nr:hypothetical protein [Brevibacillus sp. SYP-B805]